MESLLFNLVRPLLNSEHDQRMAESTLLFLPVVTPRQFQSMYKIKDPLASPPHLFFFFLVCLQVSMEVQIHWGLF